MIGQIVGNYRIERELGEGGMSHVYVGRTIARNEILPADYVVVLKVMSEELAGEVTARKRFVKEAHILEKLRHRYITRFYEFINNQDHAVLVMELVEGKSLRSLIGDLGLPVESVLRYGVQIANALGRAHDRGIIHRDLKSSNVVVTSEGLVKVLDFGLAKRIAGTVFEGSTRSFETGQDASMVSGTLPYMAPEVLRGEGADYRSDLWALGVVLYEAASGRLPFEGRTSFETSSAIMRDTSTPLAIAWPWPRCVLAT